MFSKDGPGVRAGGAGLSDMAGGCSLGRRACSRRSCTAARRIRSWGGGGFRAAGWCGFSPGADGRACPRAGASAPGGAASGPVGASAAARSASCFCRVLISRRFWAVVLIFFAPRPTAPVSSSTEPVTVCSAVSAAYSPGPSSPRGHWARASRPFAVSCRPAAFAARCCLPLLGSFSLMSFFPSRSRMSGIGNHLLKFFRNFDFDYAI